MLTAHKEGALIVFDVDGRRCTYNLATHETIGFRGKPVASLESQLKGYKVTDVIEAFDNKNYCQFLRYVAFHGSKGSTQLANPSTLFKRLKNYDMYEQYFAAGVNNFDIHLREPLTKWPKPLLKYGQKGYHVSKRLYEICSKYPGIFQAAMSCEAAFDEQEKVRILTYGTYGSCEGPFVRLVLHNGYGAKALMQYIDRICTYEALTTSSVLQNLSDYVRMMSVISPKYDKYPRNLLTTHHIAIRNYRRLSERFDEAAFERVRKPYLEKTIGDFVFMYPKSVNDIKDEAVQQNNCVASYIRNVLDGRCDIMFLRDKENPDKSLVTLEVRDQKKIVQAFQRYNTPITVQQADAISKWEEFQNKREEKTA